MITESTFFSLNYNILRNILIYGDMLRVYRGVEIGVLRGDTSHYLLAEIPHLTLWSVDPYLIYEEYQGEYTQAQLNEAESQAKAKLAPFGDRSQMVKKASVEASRDFADGFFDFCFIDGNHGYEAVWDDIRAWYPKVRKGGLVSGHDYRWPQVTQAVNEFTDQKGINGYVSPPSSDIWYFVKPE